MKDVTNEVATSDLETPKPVVLVRDLSGVELTAEEYFARLVRTFGSAAERYM